MISNLLCEFTNYSYLTFWHYRDYMGITPGKCCASALFLAGRSVAHTVIILKSDYEQTRHYIGNEYRG